MSSISQLAHELAKTSEMLQVTYGLLRQRDNEIMVLQQQCNVNPITDLLKLLEKPNDVLPNEEYVP